MKKLIIIIDALRWDKKEYFKKLLYQTELHFVHLIPPFSFEPDATFLSGLHPEESDSGLRIKLKSDFEWNKLSRKSIFEVDLFIQNYYLRKLLNIPLTALNLFEINSYQGKHGLIPPNILKYFRVAHENSLYSSASEYNTIFKVMVEHNISFKHIGVPFSNGHLIDVEKKLFSHNIFENHDVISLFISDLDGIGHKQGGNSDTYNSALQQIIDFLNRIIQKAVEIDEHLEFVVFGDHGMVDIKKSINVYKELKKLPFKHGVDYLMFLDSTMARFWFRAEGVKEAIKSSLSNLPGGSWISDEEKSEYKINYKHNHFGDDIWWCDCGVTIKPNYWQGNRSLTGMHGYRKDCIDNHSLMITNMDFSSNKRSVEMVDLYNILNKLILN